MEAESSDSIKSLAETPQDQARVASSSGPSYLASGDDSGSSDGSIPSFDSYVDGEKVRVSSSCTSIAGVPMAGSNVGVDLALRREFTLCNFAPVRPTQLDRKQAPTCLTRCPTLHMADVVRKEFNYIGNPSKTFKEDEWYNLVLQPIVALYAFFLGYITVLDWGQFSVQWIWWLLLVKGIFTILFILDYARKFRTHRFFTLLRYPTFTLDTLLLAYDFIIIGFLSNMLLHTYDIEYSLNLQLLLKYLLCLTIVRLYKICSICQPLLSFSKGIVQSIKCLVWTGVFVILVIYSCSIYTTLVFNQINDEEMDLFWGTLLRSMYTLFTVLTLEGWNEVSNRTAVHYPHSKLFFVTFVCFATLTVMNVVTGIIMDTYITVNQLLTAEKEYKGTFERNFNVANIVRDAMGGGRKPPPWQPPGVDRGYSGKPHNENYRKPEEKDKNGGNASKFNMLMPCLDSDFSTASLSNTKGSDDGLIKANSQDVISGLTSKFKKFVGDTRFLRWINVKRTGKSTPDLPLHEVPTYKGNSEPDLPIWMKPNESEYPNKPKGGMGSKFQLDSPLDPLGTNEVIDMSVGGPFKVLMNPILEKALSLANIPMYQAYDVLNLYWMNGITRITCTEFAESCDKVTGTATSRQLLALELSFARRMNTIDDAIGQIKEMIVELGAGQRD